MRQIVQFHKVKNPSEKLNAICHIAYEQFINGNSLLILVPNQQAASYVDQLLWKQPAESFLPHIISEKNAHEKCVITTKQSNINKAHSLLNLNQEVSPIFNEFQFIFELLDLTDPIKAEHSELRKKFYQNQQLDPSIIER